jgi:putative addiction module killer protein
MEIRHYLSRNGRDAFQDWLDRIEDVRARVAVLRRIDRFARGNVGDCRFCKAGVWELRIDVGPGYRVYYAIADSGIALLLAGGSKRTQQADIRAAVARWKDYRSR